MSCCCCSREFVSSNIPDEIRLVVQLSKEWFVWCIFGPEVLCQDSDFVWTIYLSDNEETKIPMLNPTEWNWALPSWILLRWVLLRWIMNACSAECLMKMKDNKRSFDSWKAFDRTLAEPLIGQKDRRRMLRHIPWRRNERMAAIGQFGITRPYQKWTRLVNLVY